MTNTPDSFFDMYKNYLDQYSAIYDTIDTINAHRVTYRNLDQQLGPILHHNPLRSFETNLPSNWQMINVDPTKPQRKAPSALDLGTT
eukprot:UN03468